MKPSTKEWIGLGVALLGVASTGCSLLLDWSPDNLPCFNGECAEGYTCLVNGCVPDGSLGKGETCNKDQQCADSLVCAPTLFTCLEECTSSSFYRSTSDCPSGEYCKPVPIDSSATELSYTGVCVQNECASELECAPEETCVEIRLTANACVTRCELSWGTGSTYSDTCGSGGGASGQGYCQPLGPTDQQKLACLATSLTAQQEGNSCKPVVNPCVRELGCINEVCQRYCNPATSGPCDAGEVCCTVQEGLFGYCADSTTGCGS